jgi:hypothetical protein
MQGDKNVVRDISKIPSSPTPDRTRILIESIERIVRFPTAMDTTSEKRFNKRKYSPSQRGIPKDNGEPL